MLASLLRSCKSAGLIATALLAFTVSPSFALARTDPATAPIDGDLSAPASAPATAAATPALPPGASDAPVSTLPPLTSVPGPAEGQAAPAETNPNPASVQAAASAAASAAPANGTTADGGTTWHKDDLVGAAEGVFGKGAAGLAEMIEDLLKKQGEPNAYIVGREGGGALVFGLRYGSGTLYHKVEGQKPVYWTGPSIGFDAGANAASTFVLVYNLYDTEELYKRFGAGEGQAYLIGGFNVSYLRRGDKVLIPVRSGAGLRLGVNAGYMKFSHKQNWLPF